MTMKKNEPEDPIAYAVFCESVIGIYRQLLEKHPCAQNDDD